MSTLSLRLPDSLHQQVKALARQDGISMNQFIASAVAEKMAALVTEEYLRERVQNASESNFFTALSKVPSVEPDVRDAL